MSNELNNLYERASDSQTEGLINKPLYIITDNADTTLANMGEEGKTTVYVDQTSGESPYSISNSDKVVTGINNVLKQARKLSKN